MHVPSRSEASSAMAAQKPPPSSMPDAYNTHYIAPPPLADAQHVYHAQQAPPPPAFAGYYPPQPAPNPSHDASLLIENTNRADDDPGCECGVGWSLFAIGWFVYIIWIAGAILFCLPHKKKDRPGLLGCLIMSIIGGIFIIIMIVVNNVAH